LTVADSQSDGQFHEKKWSQRFGAMGDEAEAVFESVWPRGFARYGLNRPPIQVAALPLKLRYTPDYITSTGLVEVQGFGRDGMFRFKVEKYRSLVQWAADWAVDVFLWDKTKKQHTTVALEDIEAILASAQAGVYPEGKPYWKIPAASLDTEWTSFDPEAVA
jgi:hypothetical protein